MIQADTSYTLTAAELSTVRDFLRLQKLIGQDVVSSPAYSLVESLMNGLHALSAAYPTLANPTVKGWVDQLYASLITTNTCYNRAFPELFVAQVYGYYVGSIGGLDRPGQQPSDGYNYYTCFSKGLNADRYLSPWKAWGTGGLKDWHPAYPQAPPAWVTAVNAVFTSWGDNPPSTLIDKGNGDDYYDRVPAFEQEVVSSDWTDFDKIKTTTTGVWTSQAQTATSLLSPASLTADAYFFLLYLLIALPTGDSTCQSLAQKIVSAAASSAEYPNDTFINQLVYLTLMYLADPMGPFGWPNQQLQAALNDLNGVITQGDPASVAIKTSLETHGKILYTASSYPMVDPYAPSVGFPQRKTDTLFALDRARATIRGSLTP